MNESAAKYPCPYAGLCSPSCAGTYGGPEDLLKHLTDGETTTNIFVRLLTESRRTVALIEECRAEQHRIAERQAHIEQEINKVIYCHWTRFQLSTVSSKP